MQILRALLFIQAKQINFFQMCQTYICQIHLLSYFLTLSGDESIINRSRRPVHCVNWVSMLKQQKKRIFQKIILVYDFVLFVLTNERGNVANTDCPQHMGNKLIRCDKFRPVLGH